MFKKAFLIASSALLLNAASTMCYKKNHFDPDTIETVPMQGGKCEGIFSIEKMKELGYTVKDIKITDGESGLNYMYILEKEQGESAFVNGKSMTKDDLKAYINELKQEEEVEKEKEKVRANIELGKSIYESTCSRCHGDGTTSAYGTARPLIELSEDDIIMAFREYQLQEKDNGMAIVMKPYVSRYNQKDLKAISAYIDTTLKK